MRSRNIHRTAFTSILAAAITLGPALVAGQTQSVQYRSPDGVEYRSLPDTDAVKSARAALEANPKDITRIIDLGMAQSGARQFREAIATFTRGLEIEPNNALLLRWRGHRYLSVREFDRASADLTRGGAIDSTIYGIRYHLGVVQYLRGNFAEAAASFAKAQPIAPDAGELAGSTDWLWMSLSRAGRGAEAKAMLDRRPQVKDVHPRDEILHIIEVAEREAFEQRALELERPQFVRSGGAAVAEQEGAVWINRRDRGLVVGGGDADWAADAEINRKKGLGVGRETERGSCPWKLHDHSAILDRGDPSDA